MAITFERYYQAIDLELETIKSEYLYKNKSDTYPISWTCMNLLISYIVSLIV